MSNDYLIIVVEDYSSKFSYIGMDGLATQYEQLLSYEEATVLMNRLVHPEIDNPCSFVYLMFNSTLEKDTPIRVILPNDEESIDYHVDTGVVDMLQVVGINWNDNTVHWLNDPLCDTWCDWYNATRYFNLDRFTPEKSSFFYNTLSEFIGLPIHNNDPEMEVYMLKLNRAE